MNAQQSAVFALARILRKVLEQDVDSCGSLWQHFTFHQCITGGSILNCFFNLFFIYFSYNNNHHHHHYNVLRFCGNSNMFWLVYVVQQQSHYRLQQEFPDTVKSVFTGQVLFLTLDALSTMFYPWNA